MVRSFLDSGVLIDAARGVPPFDRAAFDYLDDAHRIFLTSPLVRLEVLPKAAYHRREDDQECRQHGLGALDALHVAAAHLLGADEFITTERPIKPVYRTSLVHVAYLYDGLL